MLLSLNFRGTIKKKEVPAVLLAIDIGNSNISVGLFDEKRELKFLSSIDTDARKTSDQICIDPIYHLQKQLL